ncbi:MAG: GNAT family N-acetyltransferase [Actinobacteria bacterium]|nr:GNAT family N-acetyltransferase [Actinomycetota bacterium]
MDGSATPDRDAFLAFELALDERVSDAVHRERWGRLFLTPSAPLVWDANWLAIEAVGLSVDQIVAIGDDALGGEGFGHRTIGLLDEADGKRIGAEVEAEAARRPRWAVERTRYMRWRGGEVQLRAPSPGAREVPLGEIEDLRRAIVAEQATPRGISETAPLVDQLLELDRRYGEAGGDRWFVAPAAGEPLSACRLLRLGDVAQVEDVSTIAPARERGYAKATVLAALATARAEGAATIFLTAEAADWPQLFYARLGFETVGELTVLRRRP